MADTRQRTFGESLNTWMQVTGIIIAAAWGAWTFIYKEIKVPKSAPINITMNLQLKKVGGRTGKDPLIAVEMRVSATNPSGRRVYLLPSMWTLYGSKLTSLDPADDKSFNDLAISTLNARQGQFVERYSSHGSETLLAVGELFTDAWLNPNEAVSRTLVVHIPRREYDLIEVSAAMPSAEVFGGFGVTYSVENGFIVGELCKKGANGVCTPVEEKGERGYMDAGIGYQAASSESQLSLWE